MASDAELVKIVNGFILSAPPGEFMEVVTDIRALVPDPNMLNDTAEATFKQYNEEQMIQVAVPGGGDRKFLVCKEAEVGPNEYADHVGGQAHTFDHIKQTVVSSRPYSGASGVEAMRAAVERHIAKYVNDHYPFGTVGVYAGSEKNTVVVCINSTRFNPQNFWNGRWRSVWTIPCGKSGSATLRGEVKLVVHYYEDGNVQLDTDTQKKVTAQLGSDTDAAAAAAVAAIMEAEQAFHQALDASYNAMGGTVFKALRRALPITGQKVNWNLIKSYRLGQDLGK